MKKRKNVGKVNTKNSEKGDKNTKKAKQLRICEKRYLTKHTLNKTKQKTKKKLNFI